ncbi:MAG: CDP-glucose 4,6-dehydratase [Clostridiales bacterium]|jgi:CDP-glucose 4,6-dehydratase|nr:CDP-glucose 4,6-dehydratase [Clostridiales bacterium]
MVDLSFYKGKKVFVTGHTGFKGAWLSRLLLRAGAAVTGYALESPTNPSLWALLGMEKEMSHLYADVRDLAAMKAAFENARPEIVIHMAAQPIVREGYRDPAGTYATNVMGTVNLLECVRLSDCSRSVLNVTTDKVYKNNEWHWGYRENDALNGFDPYSNSKSCSELVTEAYVRSFFNNRDIAVSTARAGNVIGGGDFAKDRIIPDCVRAAEKGEVISIRNPYSIRPYQHVLEALSAYLLIIQMQYADLKIAGCYNVGPDDSDCVNTGDLAEMFCNAWGDGLRWVDRGENKAPHEAGFLKLDCSKIRALLGWSPRLNISEAVQRVVAWEKERLSSGDIKKAMDEQIFEYFGV